MLDGKAHFDDSPLMSTGSGTRPKFLQGFETADPNCTVALGKADGSGNGKSTGTGKCWRSTSSTTPYVGAAGATPAPLLYLTDNSSAFATFPGCVYTGDTRIRFKSDGTMDVWNTSGLAGQTGPGTPGGTNCGTAVFGKDASGRPTAKQNVPVPNDMVIYVKNSSTTKACVPGQIVNGAASGSTSSDVIPTGTGTTSAGVTNISYFDPDSVVTTQSRTYTRPTTSSTTWTSGVLTGPTTTVTNDVHPTDLRLREWKRLRRGHRQGPCDDRFAEQHHRHRRPPRVQLDRRERADRYGHGGARGGELGGRLPPCVPLVHPVLLDEQHQVPGRADRDPGTASSNGTSVACTWTSTVTYGSSYSNIAYPGATSSGGNRYIYASLQTLAHSFTVETYNKGASLGTLSVRGSIAQKWRGAVGTSGGSTGYIKDYSYDQRLVFASPPYFPAWTNAVWAAKTTGELKPQYGG